MSTFAVSQIDHVEMFVSDRGEAAAWYERVLGLKPVAEVAFWADDPGGPLMIATSDAGTKLALFAGKHPTGGPTDGFHRVAFRTDGAGFLAFLDRLDELSLRDRKEQPVTRDAIFDHDLAFSIYFCDPWAHNLELTTYDHQLVRSRLR
jgi:catechol 2,3-dioxygenase-like lactoylglutathione lyase family enzyme